MTLLKNKPSFSKLLKTTAGSNNMKNPINLIKYMAL